MGSKTWGTREPWQPRRVREPFDGHGQACRVAAPCPWTQLWQLCDSALPTGGFAHSSGLESAAAHGIVKAKHPTTLHRWVKDV